MSKPRTAIEVELPDCRKVVLLKLRTGEMMQVMERAGERRSQMASALGQTLEGLCQSVRSIDGKPVSFADLKDGGLDEYFEYDEVQALAQEWNALHYPAREPGKGVRAVSYGSTGPA